MIAYPILEGKLAEKGIKKKEVAKCIGVCDKALNNKLRGKTPFTWPEVRAIRHAFFPEILPDILFSSPEDRDGTA